MTILPILFLRLYSLLSFLFSFFHLFLFLLFEDGLKVCSLICFRAFRAPPPSPFSPHFPQLLLPFSLRPKVAGGPANASSLANLCLTRKNDLLPPAARRHLQFARRLTSPAPLCRPRRALGRVANSSLRWRPPKPPLSWNASGTSAADRRSARRRWRRSWNTSCCRGRRPAHRPRPRRSSSSTWRSRCRQCARARLLRRQEAEAEEAEASGQRSGRGRRNARRVACRCELRSGCGRRSRGDFERRSRRLGMPFPSLSPFWG